MAETTMRSPGVSVHELDLSAPGTVQPQGIPAGVIGTAQKGPAFVPKVFATSQEFKNLFGETEGKHFGAMAVNEWMRNSQSGLFLRTLGVGDGKKAIDGETKNAGFLVGQQIANQSSTAFEGADALKPSANPFANDSILLPIDSVTETAAETPATIESLRFALSGTVTGSYVEIHDVETDKKAAWYIYDPALTGELSNDGLDNITVEIGGIPQITFNGYTAVGLVATNAAVSAIATIVTQAQAIQNPVTSPVAPGSSFGGSVGVQGYLIFDEVMTNMSFSIPSPSNMNVISGVGGAGDFSYQGASILRANLNPAATGVISNLTPGTNGQEFTYNILLDNSVTPLVDNTVFTFTTDAGAQFKVFFGASEDVTDYDVSKEYGTVMTDNGWSALSEAINGTELHQFYQTGGEVGGDLLDLLDAAFSDSGLLTYAYSNNGPDADIQLDVSFAGLSFSQPALSGQLDGNVWFLGCEMVPATSQDYLAGATNILRGVLMAPKGIVFGLDTGTTSFDGDTASTNASAGYGASGNGGEMSGLLLNGTFVLILNGFNNQDYQSELLCSMDPTSPIYFKKVLNTDPSKLQERGHYLYSNADVSSGMATVVSGSDKVFLSKGVGTSNTGVDGSYGPYFENWQQKFENAFTPWFTSQDLGNGPKKLFRFHMLDAGLGGHNQIKISIDGITKSTDLAYEYGTFNVKIRKADDLDSKPVILQTFSNVTLDPSSDRYIARVIGDSNLYFDFERDQGKQKLRLEGLYPNRSQYVRIEVTDEVETGSLEATALPIGFAGKHHLVLNGNAVTGTTMVEAPLPMRQNLALGEGPTKEVYPSLYWGVQNQDVRNYKQRNASQSVSSLVANLTKFYPTIGIQPAWVGDNAGIQSVDGESLDAELYNNNAFSLEKVWIKTKLASNGSIDTSLAVDPRQWHEAAYIRSGDKTIAEALTDTAGNAKSEANGWRWLDIAKDFGESASKRYFKFTVPFQGGFDGLDIFDKEKSAMSNLSSWREMHPNASSVLGGPDGATTAAFRKAIDILSETTDVDIQLLAIPGMSSVGITDYAIDKTEERFDALFLMDLQAHDHDDNIVTSSDQETSVTNTSQALVDRNLDTSFAATYFPDVVIKDGDFAVKVPSSVAVLGALALNDSVAYPWFAPAGFTRGALASTIETAVKLNKTNMDVLYEADINPITSFPQQGEGVVVFGQKTLLQAQSSLDRVNVRRLLIDIRRKVRAVANYILFEPNREATLAKFSSLVNPILTKIQAQQGLDRFKVAIDTTTTTQQDVENNTIRGKIWIQPTKSIEFISLDFVVTNAGAEI